MRSGTFGPSDGEIQFDLSSGTPGVLIHFNVPPSVTCSPVAERFNSTCPAAHVPHWGFRLRSNPPAAPSVAVPIQFEPPRGPPPHTSQRPLSGNRPLAAFAPRWLPTGDHCPGPELLAAIPPSESNGAPEARVIPPGTHSAPKESVDDWPLATIIHDALGGTPVYRYPPSRCDRRRGASS
jgi:hypothetical protein